MTKQVTKSIIVKGTAEALYELWADFETHPKFTKDLKEVKKLDQDKNSLGDERPIRS